MLEINKAIELGEKALRTMENKYSFYMKDYDCSAFLSNLAQYCLEHKDYLHLTLKYSNLSYEVASTSKDATRSINAQILYQIACYKLGNGLFSKKKLSSLVNCFTAIGWDANYESIVQFITEKHGVPLAVYES